MFYVSRFFVAIVAAIVLSCQTPLTAKSTAVKPPVPESTQQGKPKGDNATTAQYQTNDKAPPQAIPPELNNDTNVLEEDDSMGEPPADDMIIEDDFDTTAE